MQWKDIDSTAILRRLHQSILEIITPAWVTNPPPNTGLPSAGSLKAETLRTLFDIHVPLTLISAWGKHSPLALENAKDMQSVLETSLWLSCALIHMTRDELTPETREAFLNSYHQHILGLRKDFPGFFMPSHHLAYHIYEFMDRFSTIRNWWAFFFETLIGRLQRIPTNHQPGKCHFPST